MAHYALVEYDQVKNVIVIDDNEIQNYKLLPTMKALKTSYNTRGGVHYDPQTGQPSADQSKALRKNYAGKGYTYDSQRDAFIPPKPFLSWILNEQTCLWNAPVAMPSDGKMYNWDEDSKSWVEAAAA